MSSNGPVSPQAHSKKRALNPNQRPSDEPPAKASETIKDERSKTRSTDDRERVMCREGRRGPWRQTRIEDQRDRERV